MIEAVAAPESDAIRIVIEPMAIAHEGSEFDFVADTWVRSGKDCPPYWWMSWPDYWATVRPRVLETIRSPDTIVMVAHFEDSPTLYLGWVAIRPVDTAILYAYVKGAYRRGRDVVCESGDVRASCASMLLTEARKRLSVDDSHIAVGTLPPGRDAIERARKRWRYVPWRLSQ